MSDIILKGEGICMYFGGVKALNNVDFYLKRGEIVGLIGPNGAGKTTLFNVISGVLKPTRGKVYFKGQDITGRSPHVISQMGIARTYQIVRCFPQMSAVDNVAVGVLYGKKNKKRVSVEEAREVAKDILLKVGFKKDKFDVLGKDLNIVERKIVELARAVAQSPDVILVDEVLAGLNPAEKEMAVNILKNINEELGITLFVIEHDIKSIANLSDRIIVLNFGEKIAEGSPEDVLKDKRVIEAYIGGDKI